MKGPLELAEAAALYMFWNSTNHGISILYGPNHVAQKFEKRDPALVIGKLDGGTVGLGECEVLSCLPILNSLLHSVNLCRPRRTSHHQRSRSSPEPSADLM